MTDDELDDLLGSPQRSDPKAEARAEAQMEADFMAIIARAADHGITLDEDSLTYVYFQESENRIMNSLIGLILEGRVRAKLKGNMSKTDDYTFSSRGVEKGSDDGER